MATVRFNGTRAELVGILNQLARIMAGKEPDTLGLARGVMIAIGYAALSDIKDAFITKARGGTDEMGIKWPKLSKEYLAYGRRFGRREQSKLKKAAGLGRVHRTAPGDKKGLLTKGQLKEWRKLYSGFLRRFMLSLPESAAKSKAAAIAWNVMKKRGAKTKLEVFGNRQVEILRDTGVLFNSLSPGTISGSGPGTTYDKPTGEGGEDQRFELIPGGLIIGSNVPYFEAHQKGGKGLLGFPRRQMIPDQSHPVPAVWWSRWARRANKALVSAAEYMIRRRS